MKFVEIIPGLLEGKTYKRDHESYIYMDQDDGYMFRRYFDDDDNDEFDFHPHKNDFESDEWRDL